MATIQALEGIVDAPPRRAALDSLLAAVQVLVSTPDTPTVNIEVAPPGITATRGGTWESGYGWVPELCVDPARINACCADDEASLDMPDPIPLKGQTLDVWTPSTFALGAVCSTRTPVATILGYASRALNRRSGRLIMAELEKASVTPNLSLTDGTADAGATSTDVNKSIARVVAIAQDCLGGDEATIFATPYIAQLWAANGNISRARDGKLRTAVGNHLVVADGAFQGLPPGGGALVGTVRHVWITGPVQVRLAPVETLGEGDVDRYGNCHAVWTSITASAAFDDCCHTAVPVDLS